MTISKPTSVASAQNNQSMATGGEFNFGFDTNKMNRDKVNYQSKPQNIQTPTTQNQTNKKVANPFL